MAGWQEGSTASNPVPSSSTNGTGSVTYHYKVSGAADSTYTTTKPSTAGTYTVRATFAATTNYNACTATANFTITQGNFCKVRNSNGVFTEYNSLQAAYEAAKQLPSSYGTPLIFITKDANIGNVNLNIRRTVQIGNDYTITGNITISADGNSLIFSGTGKYVGGIVLNNVNLDASGTFEVTNPNGTALTLNGGTYSPSYSSTVLKLTGTDYALVLNNASYASISKSEFHITSTGTQQMACIWNNGSGTVMLNNCSLYIDNYSSTMTNAYHVIGNIHNSRNTF